METNIKDWNSEIIDDVHRRRRRRRKCELSEERVATVATYNFVIFFKATKFQARHFRVFVHFLPGLYKMMVG